MAHDRGLSEYLLSSISVDKETEPRDREGRSPPWCHTVGAFPGEGRIPCFPGNSVLSAYRSGDVTASLAQSGRSENDRDACFTEDTILRTRHRADAGDRMWVHP